MREIDELDRSLFSAVANAHSPLLDDIMPRLTDAADYSKLWLGIAALLGATGNRRARRAALRGVCTLGATSLLVNQFAKRARPRARPIVDAIPLIRLSRRIPSSNSFPSGHSASAAAFASGASMELPEVGVPLKVLAGLVASSRVATGAHYPSDVVGGLAVGAAVAALGARLVPPVGPAKRGSPQFEVEPSTPRPTGAGVTLVVNPSSGGGRGERMLRRIRRQLPDLRVEELTPGSDFQRAIDDAAASAEALAVAGGDGTVAVAAGAAIAHGIPLAVIPGGTFNHFAKDIRVTSVRRAVKAIREGALVRVDVGYLNDGLFLNTASVGAYSDFVAIRERNEKRIGKPLAALYASLRTIRANRSLRVRVDGTEYRSSLFFIGNNRYAPSGFAPMLRQRMDDGLLDLRILAVSRLVSRVKVLAALVTGQLAREKRYREIFAPALTIELLDGPARITRDGELGESADHLHARIDRRALSVFYPGGLFG